MRAWAGPECFSMPSTLPAEDGHRRALLQAAPTVCACRACPTCSARRTQRAALLFSTRPCVVGIQGWGGASKRGVAVPAARQWAPLRSPAAGLTKGARAEPLPPAARHAHEEQRHLPGHWALRRDGLALWAAGGASRGVCERFLNKHKLESGFQQSGQSTSSQLPASFWWRHRCARTPATRHRAQAPLPGQRCACPARTLRSS